MNKFLKGAKTVLGVVLAIAIALPTGLASIVNAAADSAIRNPDNITLGDGVVLSKTAKAVEGMVNTWDVTLKVESPKTDTTSDTIIVLDTSGSMRDNRKLEKAKEAAKTLAAELLPEGNTTNRVALIRYASDAIVRVNFTTNYATVEKWIDNANADGATFTQAAVHKAAELMTGSTANVKNIVLLSDGEPTYNYPITDVEQYLVDGGPGIYANEKQTSTDVPQSAFRYDKRTGSGSSPWGTTYSANEPFGEHWFYNSANCAIAEAGYYKDSNNGSLYTIALETTEYGTDVLNQIATPGKAYTATAESLATVFDQIAGRINAAIQSAQVKDIMGEGVKIANGTAAGVAGAESLNWTPEFKYDTRTGKYVAEITYRVEATDEILNNVDGEGYAPLNEKATITYNGTNTADFPVPAVKPMTVSIEKKLVGQICEGCEFAVDLIYPGGETKTFNIRDGETKTIVGGLKMGNYKVRESGTTNNPVKLENYLINYSQETFAINKNRVNPVKITVTNTYETTSVRGMKIWDDDSDRDGLRKNYTDLYLALKDGDKFVAYQKINTVDNEQSFVFNDLPKYRNGEEIIYNKVEAVGCNDTCKLFNGDGSYTVTERKDGAIRNKHVPEKKSLTIKKTWDTSAGMLPTNMPTFITIELTNDENDAARTVELSGNGYGEWTSDPIEVLVYKNGGEKIQYEVKETSIGVNALTGTNKDTLYVYNGDILEGKWVASYTSAFDVKNTWKPAVARYDGVSDFTIKKVDEGGDAMEGVVFSVNGSNYTTNKDGEIKIVVPEATSVAEDNLKYTINEKSTLDGYDLIDGTETLKVTSTSKWVSADEENLTNYYEKEYKFTAKNIAGYTWNSGTYIVTNNRSMAESLVIKKTFEGVTAEALKDLTFTVNGPDDFGANGKVTVKFKDDCTVSGSEAICEVEAKVPTGKYSVKENNAELENFTLTVTGDNGASKDVKKGDKAVFEIKNKYDVDKTSYTVTKIWDDNHNQDGKRPETLEVKLKADGKTKDTVDLSAENAITEDLDGNEYAKEDIWTYTWENLPVAGKDAKLIVYTAAEKLESDSYEMSGIEKDVHGTIITNMHEPELINDDDDDPENDGKLVITKTWNDGNNELKARPDSIVVYLYANEDKIDSATIMPNEDGEWTYTFSGLYKYAGGEEIKYSIKEAYVDGYRAEINDESTAKGFTIENISTNPCAFGGCGSVVVVKYETTKILAPETGKNTVETSDDGASVNMIVAVTMATATIIIVAGAAVFAKRK